MIFISSSVYCWFISVCVTIPAGNRIHPKWFKWRGCNEGTTYRSGGRTKWVNKRRRAGEAPRNETAGSCCTFPKLEGWYRELVLPRKPSEYWAMEKSCPVGTAEVEALHFCQKHTTRKGKHPNFSLLQPLNLLLVLPIGRGWRTDLSSKQKNQHSVLYPFFYWVCIFSLSIDDHLSNTRDLNPLSIIRVQMISPAHRHLLTLVYSLFFHINHSHGFGFYFA